MSLQIRLLLSDSTLEYNKITPRKITNANMHEILFTIVFLCSCWFFFDGFLENSIVLSFIVPKLILIAVRKIATSPRA